MSKGPIDWEALGIPDYEDPSVTLSRLNTIHEQLLVSQGLPTAPEKNSPGFVPTAAQAREVATMSCLGLNEKEIALILNVELKMLKLYYKKELSVSLNLANAMVAKRALEMAMSGRFPDITKFWLKAKAGWRETSNVDITTQGESLNAGSAKDKLKQALAAGAVSGTGTAS